MNNSDSSDPAVASEEQLSKTSSTADSAAEEKEKQRTLNTKFVALAVGLSICIAVVGIVVGCKFFTNQTHSLRINKNTFVKDTEVHENWVSRRSVEFRKTAQGQWHVRFQPQAIDKPECRRSIFLRELYTDDRGVAHDKHHNVCLSRQDAAILHQNFGHRALQLADYKKYGLLVTEKFNPAIRTDFQLVYIPGRCYEHYPAAAHGKVSFPPRCLWAFTSQ